MLSHLAKAASALALVALPALVLGAEITVVATSQIQLQSVPDHASVILLDEPELIEDQMSEGLPPHPAQAMQILKTRMQSREWQQLQLQLRKAAEGVASAWSMGVAKVPAVVVDRKYVVYGQPDVAAALKHIEQALGESL